jgi:PhzF family phenazine biosynthesis protein
MLSVSRFHNLLFLDFPVSELKNIPTPQGLTSGLGLRPLEVYTGGEYLMAIYKNEAEIMKIHPDFPVLQKLPFCGIIVTSQGNSASFVSRFFAPAMGIDEDPVTGSAHTLLIPYWSKVLDKNSMIAYQVSKRGGILHCELLPDRVKIGGKAVTYMYGTVLLDNLREEAH